MSQCLNHRSAIARIGDLEFQDAEVVEVIFRALQAEHSARLPGEGAVAHEGIQGMAGNQGAILVEDVQVIGKISGSMSALPA